MGYKRALLCFSDFIISDSDTYQVLLVSSDDEPSLYLSRLAALILLATVSISLFLIFLLQN